MAPYIFAGGVPKMCVWHQAEGSQAASLTALTCPPSVQACGCVSHSCRGTGCSPVASSQAVVCVCRCMHVRCRRAVLFCCWRDCGFPGGGVASHQYVCAAYIVAQEGCLGSVGFSAVWACSAVCED
jgi:hypothetical protein